MSAPRLTQIHRTMRQRRLHEARRRTQVAAQREQLRAAIRGQMR